MLVDLHFHKEETSVIDKGRSTGVMAQFPGWYRLEIFGPHLDLEFSFCFWFSVKMNSFDCRNLFKWLNFKIHYNLVRSYEILFRG